MVGAFNKRLREIRAGAGMTQEALARAANVSLSTIAKLERTEIEPTWGTVLALAGALGVGCEAFEVKPKRKGEDHE
jgi:transcriptional regulator with XRE-family HTH domain